MRGEGDMGHDSAGWERGKADLVRLRDRGGGYPRRVGQGGSGQDEGDGSLVLLSLLLAAAASVHHGD